jgi:lysyl-tRNA synthetase, class II
VREWGADTLAPFTLRGDKSYFFSADGSAFLAYRVLAGVAVVSGDPIGPPGARAGLLAGFLEHAHERGWRVAVLGVSQRSLDLHRGLGLHAVYHGDEAVVDPARFTLEGRAMRKVRQSTHRLSRAGYRFDVVSAAEAPPELRAELAAVAARRGSGRGFAMALAELFDAEGPEAVFALGRAPDGRVGGFLHLAVCAPAAALTLSSMPRGDGTPNGFNEWLVCETIAWARANGFALVSLNFAPLAQVFARARDGCSLARAERALLCAVKPALGLQLDDLGRFGRKFLPEPERRFVVFERWGDLPRAGVACLAAEGYLPLARAGR